MVEVALYAVARIYWTVFSGALDPFADGIKGVLITAGVLTSIVGATLCFLQRHIKRMLAFSTISHSGIILTGVGTLVGTGLAGVGMYLIGHGLVKSALFICAGILLHRFSSVDEIKLKGKAGKLLWTAFITIMAGLGLAGSPPFATFIGKGWIDKSISSIGYHWVIPILILTSAVTGGTVLRMAGRVFFGWGVTGGEEERGPSEEETPETDEEHQRTPFVMIGPPMLLLILAIVLPYLPGFAPIVNGAGAIFNNRELYSNMILSALPVHTMTKPETVDIWGKAALSGSAAVILGIIIALTALYRDRLPGSWREASKQHLRPVADYLRDMHSGLVGDYTMWIAIGFTVFGIAFVAVMK